MKWIESIVRGLFPVAQSNRKSSRALARLSLTCLEDRVTPATVTWTGGGGDTNWTTAANWGGAAPMAGDDLVFADLGMATATFNDFVATTFASITIEGANYTIAGNDLDLSGDVTTTYSSGSSALALNVVLGGGDVIVASGGTFDLGGVISGSAGLTLSGGGTLQLSGSGANVYTGTTLVTAGALELNKMGATAVTGNLTVGDGDGGELVRLLASDQIADGATVAVGEGATFDLNGSSETVDALVMQGSTVTIGTGGILTLVSSISTFDAANNTTAAIQGGTLDLGGNGTFSLSVNDDAAVLIDLRITSVVANGGISKAGAGILALAGTNTYAGATAVTAGAIQAESDPALGTTAGATTVSSGASVFFSGTNLAIVEAFTIAGTGTAASGALATLSGAATLTGTIDLAANSQIGASVSSTLTVNGVIDDGASAFDLSVLQASSGRTLLGAANLFDGNVSVNGGFLRVTNSDGLGDSATPATVTVPSGSTLELAGGVTIPATKSFTLTGTPVTGSGKISNVAGSNTIAGGISFSSDQTFTAASGTTLTVTGAVTQGSAFVLFKDGTGTVVLDGNNTFVGAFLSAGTLVLNGNNPVGINGVVVSGGTLSGIGTLGAVSMTGGSLAPGSSPGVLSTADLSIGSGATLSAELNGTTAGTQYDQVSVTGSVTLGGALSASLGFTPSLGDTFVLIDNDGSDAVSGTFTGLSEGATATVGGTTFAVSYVGGTGNDVTLTAVEAATVGVVSSANPAVFGQPVTFSVTVSGSGATPSGNVSLVVDGSTVETVALVGGVATFTAISSLAVGSHTVAVNYAGGGTYTAASGTLSGGQVVNQASSTTALVSSDTTTALGESVTFTATVTASAPGAGTPTGSVEFFDGAASLGTVALSAGSAMLSTSTLPVGSHSITAVYLASTGYAASTSAPVIQTVGGQSTTTAVTTSDAETDLRESVTFTATVVAAPGVATGPGAGTPTGTVTFSADGTVLGTVALNGSGVATFTTAALAAGTRTITATFAPSDGNFLASTGTVTQTVLAPRGNDVNADGRADVIVGTASSGSHVKVLSGDDGTVVRSFFAFDGFQGGVSTAGGDVNNDGATDVIVGTSSGSSHVKVFDGTTGDLGRSFIAFDAFNGGVVVASGDIDGDGFADVIVGTSRGSSHVKVFSGADGREIRSFLAFDGFSGGVSVASGDIDGDGFDDLVVGATGGGSHVKVFSGADGSLIRSYQAFENYFGGVTVAVGDIDGDGRADVVVGAATGSSHVKVFSGTDGSEIRSFFALPNFTGNMSLALGDLNGDGTLDIIAGSKDGGSTVTSVNGVSLTGDSSFRAFDDFLGGISVG